MDTTVDVDRVDHCQLILVLPDGVLLDKIGAGFPGFFLGVDGTVDLLSCNSDHVLDGFGTDGRLVQRCDCD